MTRILIVTAVAAERDAVVDGRQAAIGMIDGLEIHRAITGAGMIDVLAAGVGAPAAAVATGCALRNDYDLVFSAGIAGGFPAAPVGSTAVAEAVVHADLGVRTPAAFQSMAELGWGPVRHRLDTLLVEQLSDRSGARIGEILTVSTVTGSAERAAELLTSHPAAVAEAMEGIGVYLAAARAELPFAELRAISNPVGPRDRDRWRMADALTALTAAFDAVLAAPLVLQSRGVTQS
ncbi:futalosine hydrolase [Jatrophihabitans telluris]|uniref:Futalosine hydrolase n=1 Tax=Jatrophihabitans telluris TaxID=2038343 RepID=A0ABY4QZV2_9ACTN|nr:futalosine hydrolase [Jatrophihabitans telluris]UQX89119.1 futalosine hydrolase [Jatrophihabitans telluris]